MKYLVMTIRTPTFDAQVIPAHYRFLEDLRDQGMLEQAGPFTDKTGGAYVLTARSLDGALHLALQDPLYLRRCSTIEVREWDSDS